METSFLPSQFLSVVLGDSIKTKKSVSFDFPLSITNELNLTSIPSSLETIDKKSLTNHSKNDSTFEFLQLKNKLPRTVLEECIVELACSTPDVGNDEAINDKDAVIIFPTYSKNKKHISVNGHNNVTDILNEVEAVYSDEEESVKPASKTVAKSANLFSRAIKKTAILSRKVAVRNVEKSCQCQLCGRKFYRNCSLALHMKCHSDEQNCRCKICGKEFIRLSILEKHMKIHSEVATPAVLICKTCGEKFNDDATLKTHIITHNEKFICEHCNVTFTTKQLLDLHIHITHKQNESPLKYKLCKTKPFNLRELNDHAISPSHEKHHITCQHCGEIFSQRCTYKKHLQLHVGEKLNCNICGIDFTQRSSMLRHYKRLHFINDIPAFMTSNVQQVLPSSLITS